MQKIDVALTAADLYHKIKVLENKIELAKTAVSINGTFKNASVQALYFNEAIRNVIIHEALMEKQNLQIELEQLGFR